MNEEVGCMTEKKDASVTIRISASNKKDLEQIGERLNKTSSDIINMLIEDFLRENKCSPKKIFLTNEEEIKMILKYRKSKKGG